MANCEFPAGLGHVSGTLSKTIMRTSKGVVTRRIVAQVRNGKQKIYIREDKPRCTRVTPAETKARYSFAIIAKEVSRRIEAGDKRSRKLIWAEVKAEFIKYNPSCK